MIHLEFDDKKVNDKDVLLLSEEIQKIVSKVTKIEDVFVYANSARIKVKAAPLEIFVQMSAHKIKDLDKLTRDIKKELITWKKKTGFKHLINLSVIPMPWKIEIGI